MVHTVGLYVNKHKLLYRLNVCIEAYMVGGQYNDS